MTILDVNIDITLLNQILTIDLEIAVLNGTKFVFRFQMVIKVTHQLLLVTYMITCPCHLVIGPSHEDGRFAPIACFHTCSGTKGNDFLAGIHQCIGANNAFRGNHRNVGVFTQIIEFHVVLMHHPFQVGMDTQIEMDVSISMFEHESNGLILGIKDTTCHKVIAQCLNLILRGIEDGKVTLICLESLR